MQETKTHVCNNGSLEIRSGFQSFAFSLTSVAPPRRRVSAKIYGFTSAHLAPLQPRFHPFLAIRDTVERVLLNSAAFFLH